MLARHIVPRFVSVNESSFTVNEVNVTVVRRSAAFRHSIRERCAIRPSIAFRIIDENRIR